MTAAMPRTFLPGGGDRLGVPPLAVCREAQTDPLAAFSDQVGHCHTSSNHGICPKQGDFGPTVRTLPRPMPGTKRSCHRLVVLEMAIVAGAPC